MIVDLVAGMVDQVRERLDSLESRGSAARGQHAFDAQGDQGVEGFIRLRSGRTPCGM